MFSSRLMVSIRCIRICATLGCNCHTAKWRVRRLKISTHQWQIGLPKRALRCAAHTWIKHWSMITFFTKWYSLWLCVCLQNMISFNKLCFDGRLFIQKKATLKWSKFYTWHSTGDSLQQLFAVCYCVSKLEKNLLNEKCLARNLRCVYIGIIKHLNPWSNSF